MAVLFRGSAMQAVFPTFVGRLVEGLLHDVAENPEEAGGGETGHDHHQKFMGKSALHASLPSRTPAAPREKFSVPLPKGCD